MVESSPNLQISLGTGLQNLGYRVDVVADRDEAVDSAANDHYDIIIIDLLSPRESLLLVLHEIREINREVEILILAQQYHIRDRVTALIQGADDYLIEPFGVDELHARIQSLLGQRARRQCPTADSQISSAHLNRLIRNLLKVCACEHSEIELVISEVRFSDLLHRVFADLHQETRQKNISLILPAEKQPTLLIDAKWMEHLLAVLLTNAIGQSPANSEIYIRIDNGAEHCSLEIENRMLEPFSREELKFLFRDFCHREGACNLDQPLARFSLARSYANCMNLGLSATTSGDNLLQVRVSNIKIL